MENVKKNWRKMVRKLSDSGGLSMCPGMCPFGLGRATFVSWQVGVSLCVPVVCTSRDRRGGTHWKKPFPAFFSLPEL